jgi:hypothetical protein
MNLLRPLISFTYWFNLTPAPIVPAVFSILGIFLLVLLIAGIVVRVWAGSKRKNPPLFRIVSRIGRAAISLAVLGGVLYALSYERVYALSARVGWVLLLAGGIVWVVFIVRDLRTRYPREAVAFVERQKFEKYLPK